MIFAEVTWGLRPTEADQRQAFEDWLSRMPADFRHRHSIVYKGGGQIVIRPIVTTPAWWVTEFKVSYEAARQRRADEGFDFTAKALPLEIQPPLPNPEKWR